MDELKKMLGEELFNQVAEALGDKKILIDDGNYIPKARFDQVNEEKKELKKMLDERNQQLEDFKAQVKDNEELTKQIEELQNQNEQTVNDYEQKLTKQKFDFAVEQALAKSDAKNVRAVKALLDLESVKMDGDKLLGLDDQVKDLKEKEPYLFGGKVEGRSPHPSQEKPENEPNPWSKDNWNLTQQMIMLRDDPEKAERMKELAGKK